MSISSMEGSDCRYLAVWFTALSIHARSNLKVRLKIPPADPGSSPKATNLPKIRAAAISVWTRPQRRLPVCRPASRRVFIEHAQGRGPACGFGQAAGCRRLRQARMLPLRRVARAALFVAPTSSLLCRGFPIRKRWTLGTICRVELGVEAALAERRAHHRA